MESFIEKIKKNWLKIIFVTLVSLIVWVILRGFIFDKLIKINVPTDIAVFGESLLIQNGLFLPIITIIGVIVLLLFSIFFILIEKNLPGSKLVKGLIYGSSFFLLLFFGFIEFYHFHHGSLVDAFMSGLADGIPFFLEGILCGLIFSTNVKEKKLETKNLLSIILITIFFMFGRIIFYNFFFPKSLIHEIGSWGYILMVGSVIGLAYYFLSRGINTTNLLKKSLFFCLIIGAIWIPYNFFPAARFDIPLNLIIVQNLLDFTAIFLGGFISEFISKRLKKQISKRK